MNMKVNKKSKDVLETRRTVRTAQWEADREQQQWIESGISKCNTKQIIKYNIKLLKLENRYALVLQ